MVSFRVWQQGRVSWPKGEAAVDEHEQGRMILAQQDHEWHEDAPDP